MLYVLRPSLIGGLTTVPVEGYIGPIMLVALYGIILFASNAIPLENSFQRGEYVLTKRMLSSWLPKPNNVRADAIGFYHVGSWSASESITPQVSVALEPDMVNIAKFEVYGKDQEVVVEPNVRRHGGH